MGDAYEQTVDCGDPSVTVTNESDKVTILGKVRLHDTQLRVAVAQVVELRPDEAGAHRAERRELGEAFVSAAIPGAAGVHPTGNAVLRGQGSTCVCVCTGKSYLMNALVAAEPLGTMWSDMGAAKPPSRPAASRPISLPLKGGASSHDARAAAAVHAGRRAQAGLRRR